MKMRGPVPSLQRAREQVTLARGAIVSATIMALPSGLHELELLVDQSDFTKRYLLRLERALNDCCERLRRNDRRKGTIACTRSYDLCWDSFQLAKVMHKLAVAANEVAIGTDLILFMTNGRSQVNVVWLAESIKVALADTIKSYQPRNRPATHLLQQFGNNIPKQSVAVLGNSDAQRVLQNLGIRTIRQLLDADPAGEGRKLYVGGEYKEAFLPVAAMLDENGFHKTAAAWRYIAEKVVFA